ncbi:MAG: (deoxy)nucleoside triphosphate pyrophosphohydrolase [Arenicellaceae bacterium]|nr:(deoxy)nucleoside triphosphate pyrophosphohydrolase [Arenicellaceae bacterium]
MPRINVVGALIKTGEKVLIAQRARGEFADKWEFPGGKVEDGETPEHGLIREIHEELGVIIKVGAHIASIDFEIATKQLCLNCYWADLIEGVPQAKEHHRVKWVRINDLLDYDLAPADIPIAKEAMKYDR